MASLCKYARLAFLCLGLALMSSIFPIYSTRLSNRLLTYLALPLAILFYAATSYGQTSLWEISKGQNTHYIGGTFHLLRPSDYPLPKEFEEAYKKVNWLVFETDVEQIEHPSFQKKFLAAMRLPTGKILADQLSSKAYAKLIHYAAKNNIDIGQWQHLKPQMVSLIISLHELKALGLTTQGVDSHMEEKAKQDGKLTTHLESIEQQIHYISTMSGGNESELILQTLDDVNNLAEELDKLSNAWRFGNEKQLFETGIKPMMKDYPLVYQSLLVERNNNWLPRIEKLINDPESKLILVGTLHLVGEDGLLEKLKNKGYKVERY